MTAAQSKRAAPNDASSTTLSKPANAATTTTKPSSDPQASNLKRTPLSRLQGALFVATLLLCGLYTCCLILPLFAVLLLLDTSLAQRCLDHVIAAYLSLPASLLELYGTRIHCYGSSTPDLAQRGEYSLLISNHPTELDWLYLWSWLWRYGDLSQLKIVLKGDLRRAPIIGWALQLACHLFLARDWTKDQHHVQRLVQHYRTAMQPASPALRRLFDTVLGRPSLQLLIFPEGTNMRPVAKQRSDAFAAEHGLDAYSHVLHPRTTGFTYIINQLTAAEAAHAHRSPHEGGGARLKAVYDMTVAFPGTRCANIKQLLAGYLPSDISFHCTRFPIDQLPAPAASTRNNQQPAPADLSADAPLAQWLEQRYHEKEQQLAAFYTQQPAGRFAGEAELPPLSPAGRAALYGVAVGWWVFAALMTWLTSVSSAWRWYMLACVVAFTAVSWRGGGDAFVLWLEQRHSSEEQGRSQAKKMR